MSSNTMVQGEAGPSVCYDPCGPQKSGHASRYVGSGTDRQRAVGEARTACLAAHRAEVSTEATGGASAWGSALGDVAEEPCAGDRGVRSEERRVGKECRCRWEGWR